MDDYYKEMEDNYYEEAEEVWRSKAQQTVDDAEMKYVVVHLHKLLEPDLPWEDPKQD